MSFPKDGYGAETLALMQSAFDAAWKEGGFASAGGPVQQDGVRTMMTLRIMAAVHDGEKDRDQLKQLALSAVGKV
jgi:hypothetical protein